MSHTPNAMPNSAPATIMPAVVSPMSWNSMPEATSDATQTAKWRRGPTASSSDPPAKLPSTMARLSRPTVRASSRAPPSIWKAIVPMTPMK